MDRLSPEEKEKLFKELVPQVSPLFVWSPPIEDACVDLDSATSALAPSYREIATAFRQNVASTLSTVTIPFALAKVGAFEKRFQMLLAAAEIEAEWDEHQAPPIVREESVAERDQQARRKAEAEMLEFAASERGASLLIHDAWVVLRDSLDRGLRQAAHELLQQGLVLLWSAFEVLYRDAFELLLNEDPSKIRALIKHPDTRKRFDGERLSVDILLQHGFDLSARLGTVLVDQQDFSKLQTIKAVYAVLYPTHDLTQALADRELWVLYQRRHLVVHRRGVTDQAYLDATGEAGPIGNPLTVSSKDFKRALKAVVGGGTALVRSLATERQAGPPLHHHE